MIISENTVIAIVIFTLFAAVCLLIKPIVEFVNQENPNLNTNPEIVLDDDTYVDKELKKNL